MGRAEVFEHTADLGLKIVASDLVDLFQTAATGLFDVIVANADQIQVMGTERIELVGESAEDLLIDWLNELIFRSETRRRLYSRFDIAVDDAGRHLEGTVGGEPIDRARHVLDHEVKAATRHALSVRHERGEWVAEVILDI
jgi:SHS2 domain-containing protein